MPRPIGFSIHSTKIVAGSISLIVNAALFFNLITGAGGSSLRGDVTPVHVLGVTMQSTAAPDADTMQLNSIRRTGELVTSAPLIDESSILLSQEFLLNSGATYFSLSALTQKPLVKIDMPLDFSLRMQRLPKDDFILQLLINEHGEIDRVLADSVLLPVEVLQVLFGTFQDVKFYPGEINGTPVKSRLKISIHLDESVEDGVREAGAK